ncbi:hypothetical protein QC762_0051980 [Podospora pseudocomata]|uniref:Uncharacterized protein n=1 Tax=Podospora pseudocomata TaxID=2093779 RepID=A0ABR0GIP8_9PEZI|nr:hypothetical protein QC762_0051980 [Podospora pseudocomata]
MDNPVYTVAVDGADGNGSAVLDPRSLDATGVRLIAASDSGKIVSQFGKIFLRTWQVAFGGHHKPWLACDVKTSAGSGCLGDTRTCPEVALHSLSGRRAPVNGGLALPLLFLFLPHLPIPHARATVGDGAQESALSGVWQSYQADICQ